MTSRSSSLPKPGSVTKSRAGSSASSTRAQRLGRAVKQVQWQDHRLLDRGLRAIGSTLVQWDALRAIGNNPGASGHELAELTFQSDQAFQTVATRLLRQELIERRQSTGRRLGHHLTPAGRKLLRRASVIADELLQHRFGVLTATEQKELLALLDKLADDN